jgi:hypothetical protein
VGDGGVAENGNIAARYPFLSLLVKKMNKVFLKIKLSALKGSCFLFGGREKGKYGI